MSSGFSAENLDPLPRRELAAVYLSAVAARDALQEQLAAATADVEALAALLLGRLSATHPLHPDEAALEPGQALLSYGHALKVSSGGNLVAVRLVTDEPSEAETTLRLSPPDEGE